MMARWCADRTHSALRTSLGLAIGFALGSCGTPDCLDGYVSDGAGVCNRLDTAVDDTDTSTTTTDTADRYTPYFPTAAGVVVVPIPESLSTEDDRVHGNTSLDKIVDAEGEVLGFARRIFTPVACVSGVCDAILFVLVHNPDFSVLDVFHPADEHFKLMKYWEEEYLVFDADDMALLRSVLQTRPDVLMSVTGVHDLVEGTHSTAPTQPVYYDVVVRGGVFTVWVMVTFAEETEALLASVFGER